ncbi:MAG: 5-(carboxyamino)imidazole ribonucleotide synthase [Pikeienuella sp.]
MGVSPGSGRAPLPPGSVIGILGGGQLGRMLAMAAARLGLRVCIYDPGPAPPAAQVAQHLRAGFEDEKALADFAGQVDVVTYEFENVPLAAAEALAARRPVRPGPRALAVSQDRADEKRFLESVGLKVARWAPIDGLGEIPAALGETGAPAILKTRRLGYDGKGQARLTGPEDAVAAWQAIGAQPSVLEAVVPFVAEISVVAARGLGGEVVAYDPGRNIHEDGILRRSEVPAPLPRAVLQDAVLAAGRILSALDYVGVIGVEFFVAGREVIVNEIAPRVHNTGHWTLDACLIDQFEQHIRAVAGWPLGDGARHSDAVMENLIGPEVQDWAQLAGQAAALHLYGKAEARPGRKMGHLTRLSPKR